MAQEGNFYIKVEAGTGKSVFQAHIAAKFKHDNPDTKVTVFPYTNAFATCLGEELKERRGGAVHLAVQGQGAI